jgi:hypothetical protein
MVMVRGKFLAMHSVVFPSETSITWTFASHRDIFMPSCRCEQIFKHRSDYLDRVTIIYNANKILIKMVIS